MRGSGCHERCKLLGVERGQLQTDKHPVHRGESDLAGCDDLDADGAAPHRVVDYQPGRSSGGPGAAVPGPVAWTVSAALVALMAPAYLALGRVARRAAVSDVPTEALALLPTKVVPPALG